MIVVGIVTVVSPKTLASAKVPIKEEPVSTKPSAPAKAKLKAGLIVKPKAPLIVAAAKSPPNGEFDVALSSWTALLIPVKISLSPSRITISNVPSSSP